MFLVWPQTVQLNILIGQDVLSLCLCIGQFYIYINEVAPEMPLINSVNSAPIQAYGGIYEGDWREVAVATVQLLAEGGAAVVLLLHWNPTGLWVESLRETDLCAWLCLQ